MEDTKEIVKKTLRDSVFTDLFKIPKYLLELYEVLHPEDTEVTENDLKDITINNIFVDNLYNDLGFRVGDKYIILAECQSTWTVNIIVRALFYMATTYQKYIDQKNLDVYSSTKIKLPEPELYVLYIGDRKKRPKEIKFSEEFFDGKDISVEVKVKMLYGDKEDDILGQYVTFSKVYNEQRKKYGRTREAITETIRICKDRNVLKEYLESKEVEVVTMMMTLYDEEQIMKNHDAALARKITEQVTERVTEEVTERVTEQVTERVTEQVTERVAEQGIASLVKLCKRMNGSIEDAVETVISEYGFTEEKARDIISRYW